MLKQNRKVERWRIAVFILALFIGVLQIIIAMVLS